MSGAVLQENPATSHAALRLACFAVAAATIAPGLYLMSRIWESSEFFGHGYLIPIVSLFLIWSQRTDIRLNLGSGVPPRFGFVAAGLAGMFELVAIAAENSTAAGVGIPGLLFATAYAMGGRPALRSTALPFGLLFFMVPPPGFIEDGLLVQLKGVVTQVSVWLLHALDQTVAAVGNQLVLPGQTLFVADACSGMTSIVTLLPIAVVVAYFLSHGIWRRIGVIASVVPLAIAANIVRVTGTVLLVSRFGSQYADNLLHEGFGLVTYIGGTLALLLVARVLR